MSKEILIPYPYTISYGTHSTDYFTGFNEKGEAYLNGKTKSLGTEYIPIDPSGKTYYYDIIISVNTGNQFYFGFERYDIDKTPNTKYHYYIRIHKQRGDWNV